MKTLLDIGLEFQALRKAARLTQAEVAARVGMAQEAVSRFERGRGNDFSAAKLLRLLHAVGYDTKFEPVRQRPTLTDVLQERKRSANVGPDSR